MPPSSFGILKNAIASGKGPVTNRSLEQLLLGIIRRSSSMEIKNLMDVDEGLETVSRNVPTGQQALMNSEIGQNKRYVYTRIQRILIHALLGLDKGN